MLFSYLAWHYGPGLQGTIRVAGNFLAFSLHLFSVRELSRSLFLPWKQVIVFSRGGLLNQQVLAALWANVLSRILGAWARTTFIFFGFLFSLVVAIVGMAAIAVWLLGPAGPVVLVLIGLKLL